MDSWKFVLFRNVKRKCVCTWQFKMDSRSWVIFGKVKKWYACNSLEWWMSGFLFSKCGETVVMHVTEFDSGLYSSSIASLWTTAIMHLGDRQLGPASLFISTASKMAISSSTNNNMLPLIVEKRPPTVRQKTNSGSDTTAFCQNNIYWVAIWLTIRTDLFIYIYTSCKKHQEMASQVLTSDIDNFTQKHRVQ